MTPSTGRPTVRDHRGDPGSTPSTPDADPTVRDHRTPDPNAMFAAGLDEFSAPLASTPPPAAPPPMAAPSSDQGSQVRDHRDGSAAVDQAGAAVRDHRAPDLDDVLGDVAAAASTDAAARFASASLDGASAGFSAQATGDDDWEAAPAFTDPGDIGSDAADGFGADPLQTADADAFAEPEPDLSDDVEMSDQLD
jgi:hypothetical protein